MQIVFIIFLVLSISRTFEAVNGKRYFQEALIDMSSIDSSYVQFLRYAIKIKSISNYPRSQRSRALRKFMEIHDELLNHYMLAENDIYALNIGVLLKYLEKNVRESVLVPSHKSEGPENYSNKR